MENKKPRCIVVLICLLTIVTEPFNLEGYLSRKANAQTAVSLLRTFKDYHRFSISSDGRIALMGLHSFKITDLATGKELCRIESNPFRMFSAISFSPNGKYLGAQYLDNYQSTQASAMRLKVTLWNPSTCVEVRTFPSVEAGSDRLNTISFSTDGKFIALNLDGSRVWNIETGQEVFHRSYPGTVLGTLLSPNGRWLLTYAEVTFKANVRGTIYIADLLTKTEKEIERNVSKGWTFSDDSTLLVIGSVPNLNTTPNGLNHVIEVVDVTSWTTKRTVNTPKFGPIGLSKDNRKIAIGGHEKFWVYSLDTGDRLVEGVHRKRGVWDAARDVSGIYFDVSDIEFSADAGMLVTGGTDGNVNVWRLGR